MALEAVADLQDEARGSASVGASSGEDRSGVDLAREPVSSILSLQEVTDTQTHPGLKLYPKGEDKAGDAVAVAGEASVSDAESTSETSGAGDEPISELVSSIFTPQWVTDSQDQDNGAISSARQRIDYLALAAGEKTVSGRRLKREKGPF